jgi:hypothetical protein
MQARTLTPAAIFGYHVRYVVLPFAIVVDQASTSSGFISAKSALLGEIAEAVA